MKIGDPVIFIDSVKREFPALLTNIFGEVRTVKQREEGKEYEDWKEVTQYPCVNLLYVSEDETKTDPYGRQIVRVTSNTHINTNSAQAYCWKFPHE